MDRDLPKELWKEIEEDGEKPRLLQEHYNISYAEAVKLLDEGRLKTAVKSNGVYSLLKDRWIKEPIQTDIPDLDNEAFEKLFKEWEDKYFTLMSKYEFPKEYSILEESYTSEIDEVVSFIEDLYELRKTSIAKDGEYGLGNLVFKEFRNLGYLKNLRDLKVKLKSQNLSLY